jgi:hypothetical protein
MRGIIRKLVIALALTAMCGGTVFADNAKRRDRRDRDSAERRHPRPDGRDRHRGYREYRPYRPHYRYHRPRHHYWSPRFSYTCRVWVPGYWDYDGYGEYWVRGNYGYFICR